MKTVSIEYDVYSFNELSEEVKKQVIDEWYEKEDYPFLCDEIEGELTNIDRYFYDVDLQYSLSYSQGDGLSFSGKFDLEKWLEDKHQGMKKSVKDALNDYIFEVSSNGNGGRYCYASKSDVSYTENYQDGIDRPHIHKVWEKVLEGIENYYIATCKQLEDYGYKILEYRMDFNEFNEMCEDHEYTFLENGKMFNR